MDAFQAIASMQPEHFMNVLGRPDIATLSAEERAHVVAKVRDERVRILTILGISNCQIESVVLEAIAKGWSRGDLALMMSRQRAGQLAAAVRRTGTGRSGAVSTH